MAPPERASDERTPLFSHTQARHGTRASSRQQHQLLNSNGPCSPRRIISRSTRDFHLLCSDQRSATILIFRRFQIPMRLELGALDTSRERCRPVPATTLGRFPLLKLACPTLYHVPEHSPTRRGQWYGQCPCQESGLEIYAA